ncbi:hypothetical protein NBRC10513v2_007683 [Rhodotorula toruloides]|uniref:Uncharacterized protein n=1 Tax=Rhodotorula toruloides TaxID=5286 RepID=A0A0K3CPI9_RHOTO|nr:hypothetical protein AAT19DRAFT_11095 [Rhodotorula toruloides]
MAQRLPSSAWSASTPDSSPSSRRRTDSNSPVEEAVYPLTRPTSSTSLAQERLAPTLPQVLSNQRALYSSTSSTTAVSSSDPPQLASRAPNHANSPSAYSPSATSDDLAFHPNSSRPSLPHPPPLSPLPDSLSALFAEPQPDHPGSMPTFFRRRANSVSDVPSSATRSNSFFGPFTRSRSRKLTSNPSASASTSDLPIISSPLFPQPPPRPLPLSNSPDPFRYSPPARSPMERGVSVAIGPKAGARLLASQEAQRAMRKADEVIVTADGEEFSIRETVPWREDGGMSTVTGAQTEAPDRNGEGRGRPRADSSSGAQSKSSSQTNHSIKRVPVPPLDPAESRTTDQPRHEKSIHDLTRQASQEEELTKEDEDAQRRRKASWSKASGAGLGSPFAQSPSEMSKRPHRRPPVAGLNSKAEPSSASNGGRSRRASTDSTASISKDEVLGQLADAIKKERKRAEAYKRECEQGEGELAEIDKNLDVLKEKFATTLEQQEQIIANLRAELDEVRHELDLAHELDEEAAREYLDLLSSAAAETVKHRTPVVTAFDPSALTSSTSSAPSSGTPELNTDKSKFSALAFRRGLSLKRRVDTHLAAYGTVASNVVIPKPPLPTSPRLTTVAGSTPSAGSTVATGERGSKRPRKLSKSRTLPAVQQSPAKHDTPRRDRSTEAPTPTTTRRAPPPPAPIFGNFTSEPSAMHHDAPDSPTRPRQPPPVSGISRGKFFGGGESDSEQEREREDGGVKGRDDPALRTVRRKGSFKKGVQGTMRLLFPSHAPKEGKVSPDEVRARNVQEWLRGEQA